jgi:hypothetical protein
LLTHRTLVIIGVIQVVLGVVFLIPGLFVSLMGLPEAPEWVDWILALSAARALGFGLGMFVAARNPVAHQSWIVAMIGVQAIDWLATIAYLAVGSVTLAQVTTAAFLPVAFMVILTRGLETTRRTEPVT